jgi:hypothetical protein
MSDDVIPQDVKDFILQNIDSIAHMEGLILVRGDPGKEWDADSISRTLFIGQEKAAELLLDMTKRGFFTRMENKTHYRYNPQPAEREQLMGRVADTYRKYLLPVTHLIHSASQTRVQQFADAFILKKEED